jgi:hypothetical protein
MKNILKSNYNHTPKHHFVGQRNICNVVIEIQKNLNLTKKKLDNKELFYIIIKFSLSNQF